MLIITADDFGLNKLCTDNILLCYALKRITSLSAMVFMSDSKRASELSFEINAEIGIHLNFTTNFDGENVSTVLKIHQEKIASFLNSNKYAHIIYNPLLKNSFDYVFKAQEEEFFNIYKKQPSFYNGHHHMHLCSNIVFSNLLPRRIPIRKTFTFIWGEKNMLNVAMRKLINSYINIRFISTEGLFVIQSPYNMERLQKIIKLSKNAHIELLVHPCRDDDFSLIRSDIFFKIISETRIGNFGLLLKNESKD